MLFEIGSIIVATVLSFAGATAPQLAVGINDFTPIEAAGCSTFDENTCLSSEVCDVFIASSGAESCAIACDMRDVASCEMDGECQIVGGVCGYPSSDPIGC